MKGADAEFKPCRTRSQRRQLRALEFSGPYTAKPYFGTQPWGIPEFVNKDGLDHGGRKHLDIVGDANMKIALQGLGFIPLSSGFGLQDLALIAAGL